MDFARYGKQVAFPYCKKIMLWLNILDRALGFFDAAPFHCGSSGTAQQERDRITDESFHVFGALRAPVSSFTFQRLIL